MDYTAECRVGRLVEARLNGLRSIDAVTQFWEALRQAFAVAGPHAVICADWRGAHVMAPEVAAEMISLLSKGNAHLERSAVLLAPGHATFSLQVERVMRVANNPSRRTFRDPFEMERFLAEVLGPGERAVRERMRAFLHDVARA
jgi:hypothetical protein